MAATFMNAISKGDVHMARICLYDDDVLNNLPGLLVEAAHGPNLQTAMEACGELADPNCKDAEGIALIFHALGTLDEDGRLVFVERMDLSSAKYLMSRADFDFSAKTPVGSGVLYATLKCRAYALAHLVIQSPGPVNLYGPAILFSAVSSGDVEIVNRILEERDDVDVRMDGYTVLHRAVLEGHTKMVSYLLERFPSMIVERTPKGMYPIHLAVEGGDLEVIDILIERDQHVLSQTYDAMTTGKVLDNVFIVHFAVVRNRPNVVRYLVKNCELSVHQRTLKLNMTPLHVFAACSDALDTTANLLIHELDCDVNSLCVGDHTPLMVAVKLGLLENVRTLIGCGVDVHYVVPHTKRSALHVACMTQTGNLETLKFLLTDMKMDPLALDAGNMSPLAWAIKTGKMSYVQYMLSEAKVNPTATHDRGVNALGCAMRHSQLDIVKYMWDNQIGVLLADDMLRAAVFYKNVELIKYTLSLPNTYVNCVHAGTRVHQVIKSNRLDIIKLLVSHGLDLTVNPSYINIAAEAGHVDMVDYMAESGGLSRQSISLDSVIRNGHLNVLIHLIDHGIKVTYPYVMSAMTSGQINIVEYLVQKGTRIENAHVLAVVKAGQLDLLKYLLQLPKTPMHASSLLHTAAESGRNNIIEYLLTLDINVDIPRDGTSALDCHTPLVSAIRNNRFEAVRTLVNAGACIGLRAFHEAAHHGSVGIFETLANKSSQSQYWNMPNGNGDTPITIAARRGDDQGVRIVDYILRKGGHVTQNDLRKAGNRESAKLMLDEVLRKRAEQLISGWKWNELDEHVKRKYPRLSEEKPDEEYACVVDCGGKLECVTPCGHMLCQKCADRLTKPFKCPICRKSFEKVIRVFKN